MNDDLISVENFVRDVREYGWYTSPDPLARVVLMAETRPEQIIGLVSAIIRELPKAGTYLDSALSFVPLDAFPSLTEQALTAFTCDRKNEAAESVIAYASLQCPTALHPHLETIFYLGVNLGAYYAPYPWREVESEAGEFLYSRLSDPATLPEFRNFARKALLESRQPELMDIAASTDYERAEVGYETTEGGLRRLYPEVVFHLRFKPRSVFGNSNPYHSTWHLPLPETPALRFGGLYHETPTGAETQTVCAVCGGHLHHPVTLNPVPNGLGVSDMDCLTLAACLSCVGWKDETFTLWYQHDSMGLPTGNVGYNGSGIAPEYVVPPLDEVTVHLAPTPTRWYWQDWALSNSRENLNRVGGYPCWIQSAEYPTCPCCQRTMPFLLQLDSTLPTVEGDNWFWGSGGIGYIFWCDACRVSALLWQCT